MHCVAGRTRSREALIDNHNVKQSTSSNHTPRLVGLSSDEEQHSIISDDEQEEITETSDSDFDAMENDDRGVGVAVSDDDSVSDEEDDQVQFLYEAMNEVENFEGSGNVERSSAIREEKTKTNKGEFEGVRRRKAYGLDILIDENASQERRCAAQRTRSHFSSNKKKKKKLKLGTISQPICIDDDDDDDKEDDESLCHSEEEKGAAFGDHSEDEASGSESYEDDHSDEQGATGSDSDEPKSGCYKRKGYACVHKKGKLTKKKHKRQDFDVLKTLKDCIYGKGEVPLEVRHQEPTPYMDLPPKFSFLPVDPKPAEKSEHEKELESIWAEMDNGLNASQHNSAPASRASWLESKSGSFEKQSVAHKREGSALPRKRHIHDDPKDFGVFNILRDSIYGEGEVSLEEATHYELSPIMDLPPKFSFSPEKPKPAEKSEEEKELDQIWAEMDYALYAIQHNSSPASQVQSNTDSHDDQCPIDEVNIATLCRQGKHHLILNEEIGLICAYCLHVGLEIKYYVPPFSENPWGTSNRRDSCTEEHVDNSVFNKLQDRITGYDDDNHCTYTGTVWNIIPGVKKTMYPHQCEAFEFLWNNLAGGIFLDKLKKQEDFPGGSGCIISHAPGTGKTRLTIVFLQTYMKLYPTCRPMIIAPRGMLLTWEEEFRTWRVDIPFHNLNNSDYSGKESKVAMNLVRNPGCNVSSRIVKLYSWKCNKSILGISYKLFEQLTRPTCHDKELRKFFLEHPGLLVLDEGHTPRNSQSLIWKAVSKVRTKRRIILSGTPFQNNFVELYNTLCLARPKFAEWNPSGGKEVFNEKEGCPRNENRGKWRSLTNSFGKVTDDGRRFKILKEIRNMIRPFVHVHKGTILQESLPGMRELVVILKATQLQKELLEDIQKKWKSLSQRKQVPKNVLKLEYEESVTAVHPALFDLSDGKGKFQKLRLNPEESVKTRFLMELIRLCGLVDEKVLVFSQYIEPLKLMASQLKYHLSWIEGREVIQMHGKVDAKLRQASIKAFNDPSSKVKVLLASTKACYEGISLVGASRVVLLDVVWNPSVERQAISRAYRLGQKKFVYTYHLITAGTRDEEKSSRQAEKDQLSELVFFNSDGAQHPQNFSSAELEDQILEEMVQQEKFRHMFEKVAIKKQTLL